jgi:hypothetical protein
MQTKHTAENAEKATAKDGKKFQRIVAGEYVCGIYKIIKRDAKELGHEDPIFPRFEWFIYKGQVQGALDIVSTLREAKESVRQSMERSQND